MQIVVLGMHRSGTSTIARLVNMMGAYCGPEGMLIEAAADNPKGFWERRDIYELNKATLAACQSSWYEITDFSVETIPHTRKQETIDEIKRIVLELDAHRPWVIKEPRLCLLFELWRPQLEFPVCIHIYRHPIQVAQSLQKRNQFPIGFGLALWEKYNLKALKASEGLPRVFISYEDLMNDPVATTRQLYQKLQSMDVGGLRLPSDREICSYLSQELYHQRDKDELGNQYITTYQHKLYHYLLDAGSTGKLDWDLSQGSLEMLHEYTAKNNLQKQLIQNNAKLDKTSNSLSDANSRLKNAEQNNHQLQTEIQNNRRQFEKLKSTIDDYKNKILQFDKLEAVIEIQKETIDRLETQQNLLEEQKAHALSQKKQLEIRLSDIDNKQHTTEATLIDVRTRYDNAIGQLELAIRKDKAQQKDIQQLRKWLDKLGSETEALVNSWRWKAGDRLIRTVEILIRRPKPLLAIDYMQEVVSQFRRWQTDTVKHQLLYTAENQTSPISQTDSLSIDAVVCVHNALEDVQNCLDSIVTDSRKPDTLYIVNDGSDAVTSNYLRQFAADHTRVILLENTEALGYTKAANQGLKSSKADYVVLLNSDTIVPPKWLERIIDCGQRDTQIGIIGPLSNAASWQSVPERFSDAGDWSINPLPKGWTVADMDMLIQRVSQREFPRVPLVNGFCFAIKRVLIDTIGYLDEDAFPRGYGEENDFCLRALNAKFQLAIADHLYVYHAKSRSFGHQTRKEYSQKGSAALHKKHGGNRIKRLTQEMRENVTLSTIRRKIREELKSCETDDKSAVLFLLPVKGGGGGAHSVVQEAHGMRTLGIRARVAIKTGNRKDFIDNYTNLYEQDPELFFFYHHIDNLINLAENFQVVVATVFHSVDTLLLLHRHHPHLLPAYYIQDYEPWFFEKGSEQWYQAHNTNPRIYHSSVAHCRVHSFRTAPGKFVKAFQAWQQAWTMS